MASKYVKLSLDEEYQKYLAFLKSIKDVDKDATVVKKLIKNYCTKHRKFPEFEKQALVAI